MKKSQLRNIIRESIKELMNEQTSCDNTMNGSCAQTHLPPNMNWPNMTNFACTGGNTFMGLQQRMYQQLSSDINLYMRLVHLDSNNQINNYSDISNWVNSTGIPQPQKGQVKRKTAKGYWGACMETQCNC